jgi:hypothetical protein
MRENTSSQALRACSVMETTRIYGAYSSGHGPARDRVVPRCPPGHHRYCIHEHSSFDARP